MSRATVIPSGMLCTPIAVVTNLPCTLPLLPAHDTPTPSPSAKECIVMISSTSMARLALAPLSSPSEYSFSSSTDSHSAMKT